MNVVKKIKELDGHLLAVCEPGRIVCLDPETLGHCTHERRFDYPMREQNVIRLHKELWLRHVGVAPLEPSLGEIFGNPGVTESKIAELTNRDTGYSWQIFAKQIDNAWGVYTVRTSKRGAIKPSPYERYSEYLGAWLGGAWLACDKAIDLLIPREDVKIYMPELSPNLASYLLDRINGYTEDQLMEVLKTLIEIRDACDARIALATKALSV